MVGHKLFNWQTGNTAFMAGIYDGFVQFAYGFLYKYFGWQVDIWDLTVTFFGSAL